MCMKHRKLLTAGIGLLLTVILIALVRLVDAAPIGAQGTSIGLSHLNQFVFDLFGVNMLWYNITDWLGVAAVLTGFVFAVTGLVQLIKRRSLLKVDREILALGGLYIVVIGLYLFFENVIINYRPIIMPDNTSPEASFPSSHTMLVCVIMGSAAMLINRYIRNKPLNRILRAVCYVIIGVTVVGRLIAGVHWFTDILGGILISVTLLSLYEEVISHGK
ncbi:phosphatase PAP2 family protein [Ruminococcus sp. M6(2020)]|uniref:Phosphatase PAP2 family protein n=2 Tax=Ruminococcus difficilis TaxID=2763069 RepID=A0A935C5T5_9FIRM|nr:phosphatase PAP2 family protein [Ruminococcus difficilis]